MQLREIMTRNPEPVSPDATLQQAASEMERLDVGVLPLAADGKLFGLVTDRDIAVRGVARGLNPVEATVDTIATRNVATCFEDQEVSEVAQLMKEKQIRRIPVLNRKRDLVGIVSLGDLALETDDRTSGDVLEKVSRHG